MPPLITTTLAARKRDPYIGTRVEAGLFTIVRSIPRRGRPDFDVITLAGPMPGWQALESLQRFAAGGEL